MDGAKDIADIEVGDQVLAYNEATGETGLYTVTAVISHEDPTIVQLTLDTLHLDDEPEQIEATPEHPFFTDHSWVDAGNLKKGDRVRRADGSFGLVTEVAIEAQQQVMYNLTVDGAHTFFVGDGLWLVHNDICGGEFFKQFSAEQGFSAATDLKKGTSATLPSTDELTRGASETRNGVKWVPRRGGHAFVRDELIADGSQQSDMWGYAVKWTGSALEIISWDSGVLNIRAGSQGRSVPTDLRSKIIEALKKQTGLDVTDGTK